MEELPRLIARPGIKSDQRKMEQWLNRRLDELDREDLDRSSEVMRAANTETDEIVAWMKADGPEVRAAEHGDIGPLRKKYPHLAKYLHPPERSGKGDKFPKMMDTFDDPKLRDLTMAVWDAARIRIIWKGTTRPGRRATLHRKRSRLVGGTSMQNTSPNGRRAGGVRRTRTA